jgi:hypothetical protein
MAATTAAARGSGECGHAGQARVGRCPRAHATAGRSEKSNRCAVNADECTVGGSYERHTQVACIALPGLAAAWNVDMSSTTPSSASNRAAR